MNIHVLIENTTSNPALVAEHGLSFLIETEHHRILFDTGQTGAFIENARQMGIDLQEVDMVVLSHGHYDHGGGLKHFLDLNDHAKIYMSRHAFTPCFNGVEKYIGLDKTLRDNERIILTDEELQIDSELSLYSCNQMEKLVPINSFGLNVLRHGTLMPDDFRHEQYLLIQERERKILFSGCSHKGILNIANWFQPDVLVGGFHFVKLNPEDGIDKKCLESAARELLQYPTRYFTGHCTGIVQYQFLKEIMGDRLEYLSTGQMVTL